MSAIIDSRQIVIEWSNREFGCVQCRLALLASKAEV